VLTPCIGARWGALSVADRLCVVQHQTDCVVCLGLRGCKVAWFWPAEVPALFCLVQVKRAGPIKAAIFAAALAWKRFWISLGWTPLTASPLADRVVFKATTVGSGFKGLALGFRV
jgi:hypothetical protein